MLDIIFSDELSHCAKPDKNTTCVGLKDNGYCAFAHIRCPYFVIT